MSTILIAGGYGTLTGSLIHKFYKEDWRIYTLISKKKLLKPAHVFEQYIFPYDSDIIKEIISSCRPDVILFTGAYDPAYQWDEKSEKDDSLNYISGLSNLLMCASMLGVKHFVYISSDKVYEDEYVIDMKEDMQVSPNSFKGMTISQGENLSLHFNLTTQMEVTVTRLANLFGIPAKREACTDIFSEMCLKTLATSRLKVNAKKIFSGLYITDAIEGLYLLINAPERAYPLYHISSMEEITEDAVAGLIQEHYPYPIDIVDQTIGLKRRIILSNERFCNEFSFEIKNSYRDIIPTILTYMENHKNQFLNQDVTYEGTGIRFRLLRLLKKSIPYLECIVFFIPFFMLNNRAVGNSYFNGINFYLLYVLLFAVMHGRQQAIFSSLLSVIGYCFRQMYTASGFSLLININTYIWIVQIFIVGLTVGHLRDKFREMEADKNEKIDFLTDRLNDITLINSSNTKIKNFFADKLISSTESIGRIYDITSRLGKAETGEVLFAALDTLTELMETPDVSIYLVSNTEYCRLASASSEKSRSFGKSISMNNYKVLFDVLKSKQTFINRSLDSTLPMMANALFDDKNTMRIVIFLWSIPYDKMTLYYANLLSIISTLVYSVFVRDADYLDALAYRRFLPDTTILQEAAFSEMISIYRHAGEKGYAESCLLHMEGNSLPPKELNDIIMPLLRATDYIGAMSDGTLAILLSNTNMKEAVHVKTRLEENHIRTYLENNLTLGSAGS